MASPCAAIALQHRLAVRGQGSASDPPLFRGRGEPTRRQSFISVFCSFANPYQQRTAVQSLVIVLANRFSVPVSFSLSKRRKITAMNKKYFCWFLSLCHLAVGTWCRENCQGKRFSIARYWIYSSCVEWRESNLCKIDLSQHVLLFDYCFGIWCNASNNHALITFQEDTEIEIWWLNDHTLINRRVFAVL